MRLSSEQMTWTANFLGIDQQVLAENGAMDAGLEGQLGSQTQGVSAQSVDAGSPLPPPPPGSPTPNNAKGSRGAGAPPQLSADAEYEAARKDAYKSESERNSLWRLIENDAGKDQYIRDAVRDNLIKKLSGKIGAIKKKGQDFRTLKGWRDGFHDYNNKLLELAQGGMDSDLQEEFDRISNEFHIFEHERTAIVADKLKGLAEKAKRLEELARTQADEEYQYELEIEPKEQASMKVGSDLIGELDGWPYDKGMTKAQFSSYVSRISEWGRSVDELWDMELKAQVRFTGSGPTS